MNIVKIKSLLCIVNLNSFWNVLHVWDTISATWSFRERPVIRAGLSLVLGPM